ncbi:MAG: hypothetical protein LBG17_03790 [Bacteroidales bacterium]|nr:hypothetical protein [Bacteroidales bacterium]
MKDGSREIKNNGGDFWLPLKADYAVKLWIDNQEDHKTDGIWRSAFFTCLFHL